MSLADFLGAVFATSASLYALFFANECYPIVTVTTVCLYSVFYIFRSMGSLHYIHHASTISKKLEASETIRQLYGDDEEYVDTAPQPLGERMSRLEDSFDYLIDPNRPYIVRLKLKGLGQYNHFLSIDDMMVRTMEDLVGEFGASIGHCHGHEISLVLPALEYVCQTEPFGSRIQCITTRVSGYGSGKFNQYACEEFRAEPSKFQDYNVPHFVARVLQPKVDYEVTNYMVWRAVDTCYTNTVRRHARLIYTHEQLNGLNTRDMVNVLQVSSEDSNYMDTISDQEKYGTFAKNDAYYKEFDGVECPDVTMRTRIVSKTWPFRYSKEATKEILSKYWTDWSNDFEEVVIE